MNLNTKINKPILLGFFILSIAITLPIILFSLSQPQNNIKVVPNYQIVPTPNLQSSYNNKMLPITFQTSNSSFPTELFIYELNNIPFTESEISEISQSFNFESPPFIAPDDGFLGETYIFSNSQAKLTIRPRIKMIDYKLNQIPTQSIDNSINQTQLTDKAINYLLQHNLINNRNDLSVSNYNSTHITEIGEINPSLPHNVYEITFQKTIDSFPIISSAILDGSISVVMTSNLDIISLIVDEKSSIISKSKYPALNYEEIKELAKTKSTINSIKNNNIELYNTSSEDIDNITITSITVAYIQEISFLTNYLQPVYVLEGNANLKDQEPAQISLYLPAIKN